MWVPGAKDGVALNHMVPTGIVRNPERDQKILDALKLMSAENNAACLDEVFAIFEELDEKYSIVRLYDPIVWTISEHHKELDVHTLLQLGDSLICHGTSLLAVKLGLSVISPFNAPFVEEVMMELGVYDEFTYYAARTLTNGLWPNGNEKLFSLAKAVEGWGRINAVEWLIPETQEIRDWLLYEGWDNSIFHQYSSNICLQKAEAEKCLDSDLSAKEYQAIGRLIQKSLEQPDVCWGVTDGERLLPKFIAKAKDFPADPKVLRTILNAADVYGLSPDIVEIAKRLIDT